MGGDGPSRGLQANVWKLYLYHFLLNLGLWWPIWVVYLQEEKGLSLGQVGLLEVPFWATIALFQVPAAALADRWGRKLALVLGALALTGAVTLFGLAVGFWMLVLSYVLWAFSFTFTWGPDSAFLYDTLRALGREEDYQRLYGRAWGINMLATVAGTLAGAPIAAATDLQMPILLTIGLAFGAVLVALTFREPLTAFRQEMAASFWAVVREGVAIAVGRPVLRYALLFSGVATLASVGPLLFVQPFLVGHGVTLGQLGFWQAPVRLAGAVGSLWAYKLGTLVGEKGGLVALVTLAAAAYGLLALWDSLYAVVAFFAMNLAFVGARPLVTDYLNRRLLSGQRAMVVSLTTFIYALVRIPASPLSGYVASTASLTVAGGVLACLMFGLGLLVLSLWQRAEAREARLPALAP